MKKMLPYVLMHLIIFIWGFTGLFGKIDGVSSVFIVVLRSGIGLFSLLLVLIFQGLWKQLALSLKQIANMALIGGLIGIHWIFFFRSIQISNISVGVACLSLSSLFVLIFQKIFFPSTLFRIREFMMSMCVMLGIGLIFQVESHYHQGIFLGIIASALGALFSLSNRHFTQNIAPLIAGFWQLFFAVCVSLTYALCTENLLLSWQNTDTQAFLGLLFLGIFATAFPMSLLVYVLKRVSPFSFAISVNLEPIYSIVLAYILFGENEKMNYFFYIGLLFILSSILLDAYFRKNSDPLKYTDDKN